MINPAFDVTPAALVSALGHRARRCVAGRRGVCGVVAGLRGCFINLGVVCDAWTACRRGWLALVGARLSAGVPLGRGSGLRAVDRSSPRGVSGVGDCGCWWPSDAPEGDPGRPVSLCGITSERTHPPRAGASWAPIWSRERPGSPEARPRRGPGHARSEYLRPRADPDLPDAPRMTDGALGPPLPTLLPSVMNGPQPAPRPHA